MNALQMPEESRENEESTQPSAHLYSQVVATTQEQPELSRALDSTRLKSSSCCVEVSDLVKDS